MATLIHELQQKIFNKDLSVSEILRFALLVAKKLKLSDFAKWLEAELNGYQGTIEIPSYRQLASSLKGWNHILKIWQPIFTPNDPDAYSTCKIGQSVGEIEKLLTRESPQSGALRIPLSQHEVLRIMNEIGRPSPSDISLIVDSGQVHGIIDKVKTALLNWTLDLEEAGIVGEDMAFTVEEKESAQSESITHNNYYAEVVQTVVQAAHSSQIQQGGRGSTLSMINESIDLEVISRVVEEIKNGFASLNLSPIQKTEMQAALQTLNEQSASPNPEKSIIKEAFRSIRTILESVAGQIFASSLLDVLARISM